MKVFKKNRTDSRREKRKGKLKRLREEIENKSVTELTMDVMFGVLKISAIMTVGAFIMYCSVQDKFKLDSATAISLKGDGVDVTLSRHDIKEYLEESERSAILNMADLCLHEEFYKDIDVSSEEDKEKISKLYDEYIESNYGSKKDFLSYKKVYQLSEDYIRRCMTIDVKQAKKLEQIEKEIKIDKASLDTEWETSKNSYRYLVCDMAVFSDEQYAEEFYNKALDGKEDFDKLDLQKAQVGKSEKVYIEDDRFMFSLEKKYKSRVISTLTSEGYPAVLVVKDRKVSRKDVESDMISNLKTINAKDKIAMEYDEFSNNLEIRVDSNEINSKELEEE